MNRHESCQTEPNQTNMKHCIVIVIHINDNSIKNKLLCINLKDNLKMQVKSPFPIIGYQLVEIQLKYRDDYIPQLQNNIMYN